LQPAVKPLGCENGELLAKREVLQQEIGA